MEKLAETYKVSKTSVTPATGDLIYESEDSKILGDQRKFTSLNASLTVCMRPKGHPERVTYVCVQKDTLRYLSLSCTSLLGTIRLRKLTTVRRCGSQSTSWDVVRNTV